MRCWQRLKSGKKKKNRQTPSSPLPRQATTKWQTTAQQVRALTVIDGKVENKRGAQPSAESGLASKLPPVKSECKHRCPVAFFSGIFEIELSRYLESSAKPSGKSTAMQATDVIAKTCQVQVQYYMKSIGPDDLTMQALVLSLPFDSKKHTAKLWFQVSSITTTCHRMLKWFHCNLMSQAHIFVSCVLEVCQITFGNWQVLVLHNTYA